MLKPKKIVVVAGEESGDIHCASFVSDLLRSNNNYTFSGIGGKRMQEAGVNIIFDLAKYGVTGLTEIIRQIFIIKKAFKLIKNHLKNVKPDLLILVDYPGFNLRLAKYAKQKLGIKILYYISPQVWGWKMNRVNTIRQNVDKMAVILPFEKQIYEKANVPVAFVGHPLADKIKLHSSIQTIKKSLNINNDQYICAMLPGSRKNEVKYLMPILRDTAKKLIQSNPNLHFIIPVAKSLDEKLIFSYLTDIKEYFTITKKSVVEVVSCSEIAIACSGTASFECALLTKPMCIIYKASWLTYYAATKFILVKFLGLCNLLSNKMVVPELLQYDCNAKELAKTATELMNNKIFSLNMINNLKQIKNNLSNEKADINIARLIEQELS